MDLFRFVLRFGPSDQYKSRKKTLKYVWNLYIISIRWYCYINTFFNVWQVLMRSFLKLNLTIGFNLWRFVRLTFLPFFFSLSFFSLDRLDGIYIIITRAILVIFKRFSFSFKGQDVPSFWEQMIRATSDSYLIISAGDSSAALAR